MVKFIWNFFLLSVAIFLVAELIPGIRVKRFTTAIVVALVYSALNVGLGNVLVLFTLPLIVITFGLFKLVINAVMLWLTHLFVKDFQLDGFGPTLLAAFLITVVDSLLRWLL